MGAPGPAPEEDLPVVLQSQRRVVGRTRLVAARLEVQQDDQLVLHAGHDLTGRCAGGGELGDVVDQPDEVRLLGGGRMVVTVAGGELGHDDPDHQETHSGLDVGPVRDGQSPVWLGEEVVEPHGGRDGGDEPGQTVPHDGDGHDDRNQDQRGGGVGEARAERDERDAHAEWQDDCRDDGDTVSVQPDPVHGDLASRWVPPVSHGVDAVSSVILGAGSRSNPSLTPPGHAVVGR